MAVISYNPYKSVGPLFKGGLDYIIQNSNPDITIEDLTNLALWYIVSLYPQFAEGPPQPIYSGGGSGVPVPNLSAQTAATFESIIPNVANDYMNLKITRNSTGNSYQANMAGQIMRGIKYNTADSYENFFNNVDENIATCGSNNLVKGSLYIASAIARSSAQYWNTLLAAGDATGWDSYIYSQSNMMTGRSNWAANYNNMPFWMTASLLGSLSGYAQVQFPGSTRPGYLNDSIINAAIAGALIGSLGLTSGKIMFKWSQNMPKQCGGTNAYPKNMNNTLNTMNR